MWNNFWHYLKSLLDFVYHIKIILAQYLDLYKSGLNFTQFKFPKMIYDLSNYFLIKIYVCVYIYT